MISKIKFKIYNTTCQYHLAILYAYYYSIPFTFTMPVFD